MEAFSLLNGGLGYAARATVRMEGTQMAV